MQEDETHAFEYDPNGNMVRKTVKASGATWRYGYTVYDELATASRHASASSASPADLTKSYVYDGLGRRTLEKTRGSAGDLTAATAWIYDGEQIAYEQQLRLDGSGTEVIPYASILCALPEVATQMANSCRITTRWYTPSDVTDEMIAATPDVASAPAGTPTSPTAGSGSIPKTMGSNKISNTQKHTVCS